MTDEQIVQFLVYKAKKNGQLLKLFNPRLVIYNSNNGLTSYLAMMYENNPQPFFVRFVHGSTRGIFKIKIKDIEPEYWRSHFLNKNIIEYDLTKIPASIKHFVSYAIIEALQTKGYGFDLFGINFGTDPELIDPDETYEEAAIETDLLDFSFDD